MIVTNKLTFQSKELITNYLDYLEHERRLDEKTREVYSREVTSLLTYCENNNLDISTLTLNDLESYIVTHTKDMKARTVSKIESALRSFFKFLIVEKIREDNPTLLIEKPKKEDYLPYTLTEEEVNDVLSIFKNEEGDVNLSFRDYTFFEVIYSCGLRISEAVNLELNSYNPDEKTLRVIGKRSKERITFVGEVAAEALDEYLRDVRPVLASRRKENQDRRVKKNRESEDALFLGRRGQKLTRQAMHKRYHALLEKYGIKATVHTLRHSFATHLLNHGANIREVQTLLGHSDIKTTQIYTHIEKDELLDIFDKFSPLS